MNEKSTRFFNLVRDFLTVYLPDQRAVSVNTIKSYRECLNQLLSYICDRNDFALGKLNFEHLSRETVESYLEYLEKERHCSVSTRNHRLACIRSFVKYAGVRDVSAFTGPFWRPIDLPFCPEFADWLVPYCSASGPPIVYGSLASRQETSARLFS